MSFDTLVKDAQPALIVAEAKATEGRSWDFAVAIEDGNGAPVDLTGVTVQARVLTAIDGTALVTFSTTIGGVANNEITLTATPTDTAGKAGSGKVALPFPWHLTLTNGAGRKVDVWGVQASRIIISQGA